MESGTGDHLMFIERFLQSFKELGGNIDGTIDYDEFQTHLSQESDSVEEILHLINDEGCVSKNTLNFFQLCASLLASKVAFNNLSLENGRVGNCNIPLNTRTYTRRKNSIQSSSRQGFSNRDSDSKIFEHQITGSLFSVAQDVLCNRYHMEVLEDSYIEIFIKPLNHTDVNGNLPMNILILQDKDKVVTSSFCANSEEFSSVKHHFKKGKYVIVPVNLIWPEEDYWMDLASLIDLNDDGEVVTTDAFKKALRIVFNTIDLDQNGLLSQLEFDLFIQYTSGETAANEWSTIEDNFHTEDRQLTFEGFLDLYKMVLQTDPPDVIHMLQLMGMNRDLEQQNAQPFTLFIKSESSQFLLSPLPVASFKSIAEKGLCKVAIEQGSSKKVKNMNDLFIYTLKLSQQVTLVIQNQSHCKVSVKLDCSRSVNLQSHRNTLDYIVEVMPKTSALVHYLIPIDPLKTWSFECFDELV